MSEDTMDAIASLLIAAAPLLAVLLRRVQILSRMLDALILAFEKADDPNLKRAASAEAAAAKVGRDLDKRVQQVTKRLAPIMLAAVLLALAACVPAEAIRQAEESATANERAMQLGATEAERALGKANAYGWHMQLYLLTGDKPPPWVLQLEAERAARAGTR